MNDSIDYYVPIKSADVHFWCPFFEAFEGMLVLRTPEPAKGKDISLLHMMVSPDYRTEFEKLLKRHRLSAVDARYDARESTSSLDTSIEGR